MTSTTSPDAEAQRIAIDTDGFLYLADSAIGIRAAEFAKKGWPRTNIEGLRFLKKHTVDDEVSQSFSATFERPLILYIAYCQSTSRHPPWVESRRLHAPAT